jgi:hypothetical protein
MEWKPSADHGARRGLQSGVRFVSRFIMGHSATASAYLEALGARFGATVTPAVG